MHTLGRLPPRRRARDDVRDLIRTRILDGTLPGSTRLDEVGLSRDLGVSRTPFREAMIALQEEGLVQSRPNKGFTVTPIDEALVRDVYPVLRVLEAGAIRLTGARLKRALPDLAALNARLAKESDKARQYDLDAAFHRRLVADCGNPRLLRLIEQHWEQAQRFNGAHDRGTADRDGSCHEHAEIIAAIDRGDMDTAASVLERHWARGEGVVVKWLKGRS